MGTLETPEMISLILCPSTYSSQVLQSVFLPHVCEGMTRGNREVTSHIRQHCWLYLKGISLEVHFISRVLRGR